MTSVFIETLGCKLNQAESETLRRDLAAGGYRITASTDEADVFLLNTCTVTHIADRKARQAVRAAVKANPVIAVIITGCYARRDRDIVGKLPGVVAVLDNMTKGNMVAEFKRLGICPADVSGDNEPLRTRSLLKIQDGCDHRCAYCVVPLVRPVKNCVAIDMILAQVKERQTEGCREVVLTGTEIGEYAYAGTNLTELLKRVLDETTIERIRISSLQPQEVTPDLIGLWHDKRLCRHFHLSLQSGSDSVLHRMRRRYSTADYSNAVELVREQAPGAAVTTDIIAGFPGETEAEFEESLAFIESIGFARLHVFTFSPRPGTAAAKMPDQIEAGITRDRVDRLLKLGQRCESEFRRRFKGRTLEVLVEDKEGDKWVGYTDNYIRFSIESNESLEKNRIVEVRL